MLFLLFFLKKKHVGFSVMLALFLLFWACTLHYTTDARSIQPLLYIHLFLSFGRMVFERNDGVSGLGNGLLLLMIPIENARCLDLFFSPMSLNFLLSKFLVSISF